MSTLTSITESGATQSALSTPADEGAAIFGIAWVHPTEQITRLERGKVVFGRSSDATVQLKGRQVSRHHAELKKTRLGWLIRDLSSKNGVQVNGVNITETALTEQDVVRIGDWVGIVTVFTDPQITRGEILMPCGNACWGAARMSAAFEFLCRAACSFLSVTLVGETGSGKEVFAKNLHMQSGRPGQFIATNCATIPEHLAEGELFGYRRGAFTGADRANPGHFRAAHNGTLFLDEVSDLPASIQVKLLRAIEDKAIVPLGQSTPEPAHARIVCAAQLSLHEYVEQGAFRADLYSRLNGVEVKLPPLRKRREEVLLHFKRQLQPKAISLSPEVAEQLCVYDWPLNIREVVQLAERTKAIHGDVSELQLHHLPERIATFTSPGSAQQRTPDSSPHLLPSAPPESGEAPRDRLAQQLADALREARGNVTSAARQMGVSRPMAYRLLKRLPDLDPEEIRLASLGE